MKKRLGSFVKTVKSLEREPVELKGSRDLHDYAGMNPEAAEVMGWPDEHHAILLDKHQDENTEVKNLVHETVEQEDMKKGMSYHDGHVDALKAEETVKTPGQLVNKVKQIRSGKISKTVPAKLSPSSPAAKPLLKKGEFPDRDKTIKELGKSKIVEVHDDGDLTVNKNGSNYVVTTEGQSFKEVLPMSKHKVKVTSNANKFFHPKVEMDWHKNENVDARREHALKAHDGDELSTARALGALANVTQDKETSIVARKDANYFYAKHNRERNLGAGVVRDRRGQHLRMD